MKKDGGEDVAVGSVAVRLIWARDCVPPDVFGDDVVAMMSSGPTDPVVEESGTADAVTGATVCPSEGTPGIVRGTVGVVSILLFE